MLVAVLKVTGFSKVYDQHVAVNNVTFEVLPGQIVGMLGPNGAGKTTTMKAIAGVHPPTAGTITVDGIDVVARSSEAKRRLAYIPDDPNLFEALSVWEHLELAAALYRVPDWKTEAEKCLTLFELTDKRDALGNELSRGMRQKVAIASGLLYSPRLLMLDEPLTGLDPRGIRTIKKTLLDRAAAGAAVMISSHLLALVEDLCTHLLIYQKGQIIFAGPVEQARAAVAAEGLDSSLEEVFFRVTEGIAAAAPAKPTDDSATDRLPPAPHFPPAPPAPSTPPEAGPLA